MEHCFDRAYVTGTKFEDDTKGFSDVDCTMDAGCCKFLQEHVVMDSMTNGSSGLL